MSNRITAWWRKLFPRNKQQAAFEVNPCSCGTERPPAPPPTRRPGAILFVATPDGFLTFENGVYGVVANVRYATPFHSFKLANQHGSIYRNNYMDEKRKYYAVVRPA